MVRLLPRRCEEIKQIAIQILMKYDVSSVPIDVFELAEKMGIKVTPYSCYPKEKLSILLYCSKDGVSLEKDSVPHIFYNDEKNHFRIRYTIMHEIGHIVLNHQEQSELAEKEANFFAKNILAPPVLIHELHISTVEEIVVQFDISLEAATYAFDYYQKWLHYGKRYYTPYECDLLQLFGFVRKTEVLMS